RPDESRPAVGSPFADNEVCSQIDGRPALTPRGRLGTMLDKEVAEGGACLLSEAGWCHQSDFEASGDYNPCSSSQAKQASATSDHPLSMVSEWPRSSNSTRLVFAGECRYCLSVDLVIASGAVGCLPAIVSNSG